MSGRWLRRALAHACAVAAIALCSSAAVSAEPHRIVSLNVCADQILVDLVPRVRIAAVTHLATDPLTSARPERAAGLRSTRGAAEDVIALAPDLVFASRFTTPATVGLLARLGFRLELVPAPQSIDGVRALIRSMAATLQASPRGEALVAEMDRRIAAASALPREGRRPTALVYQVNNYVSADGGLVDEALRLAGFDNGARRLGIARGGQVGIEAIVANPPDVLILTAGPNTYRTTVADNLRHPALADLTRRIPTLVLPWPLWLCGTHHIAETVEQLAALHNRLPR
jgi:iron complex transport system substrate-binding protein